MIRWWQGLVTGLVLLGLAKGSLTAAGQEASPVTEIVVTASREMREVGRTPAYVTVITRDEIERSGARTLADVLQTQPGLHLRSVTGNPTAIDISLRGFGENSQGRVLLLLDDCPVNPPDMASINWLEFPLVDVERVEIVRGIGNTRYGDHALAGVIHILTRTPRPEPYLSVSAMAGSFGTVLLRGSGGGAWADTAAQGGIEYQASDGYRDRSRFEAAAGSVAAAQDWGERAGLRVRALWTDIDTQWPGPLTRAQMRENPRQSMKPDDDSGGEYLTLIGNFDFQPAPLHTVLVGMRYAEQDVRINMASWSSYANQTGRRLGAFPKYRLHHTLLGRDHRLHLGLDVMADRLDVERFGERSRAARLLSAEIHKDTLGGYVQDELEVADGWTASLGVRGETAEISAECRQGDTELFDDRKRHEATALELSLVRTFAHQSKVFARVETLYRYPFVDEQVSYYGYGSDQLYTDLEPERGWTGEVGTEAHWKDRVGLILSAYEMNLRDEIAYNLATYRNENLDETRRRGLETQIHWTPNRASRLTAHYSLCHATYTGGPHEGKTIPLVPTHRAACGVRQALLWGFTAEAEAVYIGSQYLGGDTSNTGEKLSDYVVVQVRLRHSIRKPVPIESFFVVENLFDRRYATVGYYSSWGEDAYYPAPGRFVRAGLSLRL